MKRNVLLGSLTLTLAACAVTPMKFELIDEQSQRHSGVLDPGEQRLSITLGKEEYSGFYVLPSETYTSSSFFVGTRRFYASPSHGTITGNRARAHLDAPSGASLACEFLVDGDRAAGECSAANGRRYQFVARR